MTPLRPFHPDGLRRLFEESDALVILAGRGFASEESFDPLTSPRWFRCLFRDFIARHRFRTIAEGLAFRFPSPAMEWAFLSRLVYLACLGQPESELAQQVVRLASLKPSFFVTTNIDGRLRAAGFGEDRLFELAGNLQQLTCRRGCCAAPIPADGPVRATLRQRPGAVAAPRHVPRCPRCSAPLAANIARSERFAATEDWALQAYRLALFARTCRHSRLLVLELGLGPWNNALHSISESIIRGVPASTRLVVGSAPLPRSAAPDRAIVLTEGIPRVLAALSG